MSTLRFSPRPSRFCLGILFLPMILCSIRTIAQDRERAFVQTALDQYRRQHLAEKIYVHTDKDFYVAGEICWFKLYVVEAGSHRPLDLSKVAYLEWLDPTGKPVLQAKTGLSDGHGDGSVYLPLSLHSGQYMLRAYTNWMKNYGPESFFEKTLTVVNTLRLPDAPVADTGENYRVDFFPEGGNLVENLTSRIAFRVTDRYGRGAACTGVVMQDEQDTLVRCEPYRFGIGTFDLKPGSGHHYRAIFRLADGTAIQRLLPAAWKEGIVMRVSAEDDTRYRVDVQSTSDGTPVYLAAINRSSLRQLQSATLQGGKASFSVDRHILGEGIAQLTLFNAARQPMCERLVFDHPASSLHIDLQTDENSYAVRKKISLRVGADASGLLPGDCSIAVYRLDSLQAASKDPVNPWLWLTSDLKGAIESPGYYFEHPEDRQAMDNLMISHGWRRYRWEDVLHPAPLSSSFPPEYQGSILSGRIVDARTGAGATTPIQAYLSVPGVRTQFASALGDDQGRVRFELKDFYGGQSVIVQTNPLKDSNYRVELANPFFETYNEYHLAPVVLPVADSTLLTDKGVEMQVLNRYIGERLKRSHLPDIDTTAFYDRPDYSYLLDNYVRFTTMEEVMREYVVLMLVQRRDGHYHLPLFNFTYNQFFNDDPLLLLDGVPIFHIDSLMALDPLKIRRLQTVNRRVFMGAVNFPGIMNWTTYKGDLGGYILDPHATVVDYEGLQLRREFYSPSYTTDSLAQSHLPDFRTVLYWTPDVPTMSHGKGELNFYSSDIPGKYVVVAQGITREGLAGTGTTTFEVK
ncbi:MAG TPA: hypothetical protein VHE54_14365 [Puia sp.]|nr:hypothetical protein [Puia sp.]